MMNELNWALFIYREKNRPNTVTAVPIANLAVMDNLMAMANKIP